MVTKLFRCIVWGALLSMGMLAACSRNNENDENEGAKNDSGSDVVMETDAVILRDSATETANPGEEKADDSDTATVGDTDTPSVVDSDTVSVDESDTADTDDSESIASDDSATGTMVDSDTPSDSSSVQPDCEGAPPLAHRRQGVCEGAVQVCSDDGNWVEPDYSLIANFEVVEVTCDGLDNDCDGFADGGLETASYFIDQDGDGFGAGGSAPIASCQAIDGYANNALDCDDTDEQIFPDAAERCNGRDDNCDGAVDETFPEVGQACDSADSDFCENGVWVCATFGTDVICQESIVNVTEICANGIDDNCDGIIDEYIDLDSDGWGVCDGDCCDDTACSPEPHLVNPGAFEYVGNGLDDDCDPATSDTAAPLPCSIDEAFSAVDGWAVAGAMELCQVTTASPRLSQRKWGVIAAEQLLANGTAPSAEQLIFLQEYQAAVLEDYGTEVFPQNGSTMAGLSSGRMRDEADPDFVLPQDGISFSQYGNPPADYLAAHGGQLPSTLGCFGECPSGNDANDAINVRLTIRVPTNAQSFSYKVKFYSAEYPDYLCDMYNDFYLALLQSESPDIPEDNNISFDSVGNPVSVNNGFFTVCEQPGIGCYTCDQGPLELAGTGMDGGVGGGTQWLLTSAPVVPGETIVLELMIFDVGDTVLDSLVLLDDFQWDIDPAEPGTVVIIE